ncbi:MAG: hypothetical protein JSV86_12375 [Gemmatimonadota bacterium]|nr:MAG: hypothetical protein JSV86_12375 [Gemmatimonadota bacterium]
MVNFHKVLISTAIVFTLGFAVWSAMAYASSRQFWALASAVGFGVATVVFVLYLRNLKRFLGEE